MNDNDVVIVATSMTPFGRHDDTTVKQLSHQAVDEVLATSGLCPEQIGVGVFSNATWGALEGQLMVGGQIALREIGISGVPIFNVENACAGGASALHLAISQVLAGSADIGLAVGVEKMNVGDKSRSFAVFDGAYDVEDPDGLQRALEELGGSAPDTGEGRRSVFMDIYAATARAHMKEFGTTARQIAAVASKNHAHAVDNDRAFFRAPISVDDVLRARALADPLTVPMCSPITDGAAAALVTSRRVARQLGLRDDVTVLASIVASGRPRRAADIDQHVTTRAADRAYRAAGLGPGDVDVAEVHDATAFGEIMALERTRLCRPGRGGPDAEAGRTSLGGELPVNPSGGLESKGHPLSATGLAQVHELVGQLRGECGSRQVDGARTALAENGGGFHRGEEAVAAVTILGRSA